MNLKKEVLVLNHKEPSARADQVGKGLGILRRDEIEIRGMHEIISETDKINGPHFALSHQERK